MSRNKFARIKKFLHFNNNKTSKKPGYDPLFKIRPVGFLGGIGNAEFNSQMA